RTGSVAIKTDNVHYKSDLMLNGSVIVALVLDQALHVSGADAIFGIAIALWLAWGAYHASSEAVHQLMDRDWPAQERQQFLHAVADRPLTGHPAGVMPLERWLDDAQMQAIAEENNLSETAFTVPSEADDVDYDLRWFTPAAEVELCGHATLAAGHVLIHSDPV